MRIRLASPNDRGAITRIASQVGFYNFQIVYIALLSAGLAYVAVDAANRILGYITYLPIPFSDSVICLQIGIHPAAQRQGLGGKLMDHLKTVARACYGSTRIWIYTLSDAALRWYCDKRGWEHVTTIGAMHFARTP